MNTDRVLTFNWLNIIRERRYVKDFLIKGSLGGNPTDDSSGFQVSVHLWVEGFWLEVTGHVDLRLVGLVTLKMNKNLVLRANI